MDVRLRSSAAHVRVNDVEAAALSDADDHHLRRVLRLRDGAAVTVTNGAGTWCGYRFTASGLERDGDPAYVPEPAPVTLAVALPKGDRAEWLVQKCTEIGVDRIVLMVAEHSVVRWREERADRQLERLRRVADEAARQSRRVWWPTVTGPLDASGVVGTMPVAELGGRPLAASDATLAVGPEGGWSPNERALAHDPVSLGGTVLRVETAAIVAAARMVASRA